MPRKFPNIDSPSLKFPSQVGSTLCHTTLKANCCTPPSSPHIPPTPHSFTYQEVYHIHILKINNILQVRCHIKHRVLHIHLTVETMLSLSYMSLPKGNQASCISVAGGNFGNYSDTNPS